MKTRTFQLKDVLSNPFRRTEKYPLLDSKIEDLMESIEATDFWENVVVRINEDNKPELAYGHHRLAALRKLYSGTKEFDWIVRPLTDGVMIQMMARENGESYKTDASVLRETIIAAVEAHGQGKILPSEMPIDPKTNVSAIRYAPYFAQMSSGPAEGPHPYTVDGLAKFLGLVKSSTQKPTNSFEAAFGAVELISEGYLSEARIKGLEIYKLAEVVSIVKQQRAEALKESKRLAAEAETRRKEAERKASELVKQKAEAEARRVAAVEDERVAAIKRAEEKAKRDAEEKIRREAEEKRRKSEAEARAIAEAKRKEDEAKQRAVAEAKRKEEAERQRKIREAQQAEAERQRVEAEKVRQIALAKAKKEEDERKAAQIVRDAEAAKARAEAEAKRKEEAARQAEVVAKKRAEDEKARQEAAAKQREVDEKARQAAAAKKRAEDDARVAAQRKAQQEAEARKEAERAEAARLKVIADKKAADEAVRRKQEEINKATAEAKKKEEEAKKEAAAAKTQIREVADKTSAAVADMTRKEIREGLKDFAEDAHRTAASNAGRKAPTSPTHINMSEEKLRQFVASVRSTPPRVTSIHSIPKNVIAVAKELVSAGRKALAVKRHPDTGGSAEEMQILNAAHQWLTLLITQSEEK